MMLAQSLDGTASELGTGRSRCQENGKQLRCIGEPVGNGLGVGLAISGVTGQRWDDEPAPRMDGVRWRMKVVE